MKNTDSLKIYIRQYKHAIKLKLLFYFHICKNWICKTDIL